MNLHQLIWPLAGHYRSVGSTDGRLATAAVARPAEDLINAASRGDAVAVQAMLARGVDINSKTGRRDRSNRGLRERPPQCSPGAARQGGRYQRQNEHWRDCAIFGLPEWPPRRGAGAARQGSRR